MLAFIQYHSLLILVILISTAEAVLVNVTVDDASPDPLTGNEIAFLPAGTWNVEPGCTACTANPDAQHMNGGTWHDTTYYPAADSLTGPRNLTFTFNGTAIYVFCALAQSTEHPYGYSNMSFYIDGEFVDHFEKVPPGNADYVYNVPVYSNPSLTPGLHQFTLANGKFGDGGRESLTLFDYLVYSYDDGRSVESLHTTEVNSETASASSIYTLFTSATSSTRATFSNSVNPEAVSGRSTTSSTPSISPVSAPNFSTAQQLSPSITSRPSDNAKPVGLLVGALIGIIGALIIVIGVVWFLLRRRKGAPSRMHHFQTLFKGTSLRIAPYLLVVEERMPQDAACQGKGHTLNVPAMQLQDISDHSIELPPPYNHQLMTKFDKGHSN